MANDFSLMRCLDADRFSSQRRQEEQDRTQ